MLLAKPLRGINVNYPGFGVRNALVSLNGPFLKFLLKQEDNCSKNVTRLPHNLWATFLSPFKLYNCHKNAAWRQTLVIWLGGSPVWSRAGGPGHNVPAVVMMTAMILQQTSSSQERSRARPGNKTQPGSIIWGLFPFEWVFHLHQGCCPVETKIPPFSPPLRFFLDCVNTLKILPVGWISRPATPWQTAVWWNNHFNSSPASARLGRIHNIHCVEKPWNKSVSVA